MTKIDTMNILDQAESELRGYFHSHPECDVAPSLIVAHANNLLLARVLETIEKQKPKSLPLHLITPG